MSVKATFLIPLKDNDGHDLSDEIALLKADLRNMFGGFTMSPNPVLGEWIDDGHHYVDCNLVFWIVLPEDKLDALQRVLLEFKRHTLQQAIYLEVQRQIETRFV